MNKTFAVARWEYLDKVRKKAFWIGVLLLPIIIGVSSVVPALLASKPDDTTKNIGIVDLTDSIAAPLQQYLNKHFTIGDHLPNYALVPLPVDHSAPLDSIRAQCDKMTIAVKEDGKTGSICKNYILIPRRVLTSGNTTDTVEYRGASVSNMRDGPRFERAVQEILFEQTLQRHGIDSAQFQNFHREVELKPIEVTKTGGAKEKGFIQTFGISYVFIILFMMMVMTSGQLLVRSMLEEKSNRIIEILFSSASPTEILAGKVLGLSAVGITQILLLIGGGIAVLTQTGFDFSTLQHIPLVILYFILGYTLYASLFVGIGAIATTEQEAQQITAYMTLLLIFLPFMFIMSALQNPNDELLVILSQIPLLTPSFMMIRIPNQLPEWWEIALSLTTLVLTIIIVIKLSSKVFRIAMLMYGKRPTLKEIIRFARE